ncbi:hypothetical protein [Microbulbifer hydrolyticus]|uniref:DUF2306 domain-containing protein n=1 Tax=Microbulbifer hydrolyticus TaxID=48074 RepID=A0A6P1T7K7_9GAMM|nr:hypothetical protein [Microbulbifer hydrolyticus]MBB5211213.1 hypothetical protein [Microbulbifer hydrolyticus]QHQ38017.1 hypothetical protein GTQ55_02710 [Microbulbifer hydrolyticus]
MLGLMVITVLPHYGKILEPESTVSVALVLHGIFYLGWFVLFMVQSHLVAGGNIPLHRGLGYTSVWLFGILLFSGTGLLVEVMQSYDPGWDSGEVAARASFAWGILHTLVCFSIFYMLGVTFRKRSHLHKRFMLLASLSMISASVTRVAYLPEIPAAATKLSLLLTYGFLLTPILIDRWHFGKVHPVLKWGLPTYIGTQILCVTVLPTTRVGQILAFPF